MDATVELISGMVFTATPASGHAITLDAAEASGGAGQGPTPMELVLLALGGCAGMDVISILRKQRQEVTGYRVQLHGDRAAEHPRVFTTITVEHQVRGRALDPAAVRRAVELSAIRYCPVGGMLGRAAALRHRIRITDEALGTETESAL